jgi:hypothetical protein
VGLGQLPRRGSYGEKKGQARGAARLAFLVFKKTRLNNLRG